MQGEGRLTPARSNTFHFRMKRRPVSTNGPINNTPVPPEGVRFHKEKERANPPGSGNI
jgi:hypothetical protein